MFDIACARYSHSVEDYLPSDLAETYVSCAKLVRTQPAAVLAAQMILTATTIGGKITLKMRADSPHMTVPTLFMTIIGRAGYGKSPALKI